MSKIGCFCGHVLRDTTDFLQHKASLLSDQDQERFWGGMAHGLAELLAAARSGREREWTTRQLSHGSSLGLDDQSLISDYATSLEVRFFRTVYQCEKCGRLLLEDPNDPSRFLSFLPEHGAMGVLASKKRATE